MSEERARIKRELGEKITEIGTPDFVRRYLCRFLPECRNESVRPEDFELITMQNDGTGAATVEFRVGGSGGLFGKLYPDDSGIHAYEVLTALWENGFDHSHRYQVPEPLCFITEYNLLLVRKAPGECLDAWLAQGGDAATAGVKEAARWLLRLHGSPLRIGHSDHLWYMFRKLSERLTVAAVSCPGETERLVEMLFRLSEVGDRPGPLEEVQVHGQFRPIHVFLGDDAVCVIDLDRSQPSEPAQDLGEFVHRLRTTLYRRHGTLEQADALTDAFLGEYGANRPSTLGRVSLYRGFHVMASLCRHMKKHREGDPQWMATMNFYVHEFDDAFSRTPGLRENQEENAEASPFRELDENELSARAAEIMRSEFVEKVVYPAVFGKSCDEAHPPAFKTFVAQEDRRTGRVNVGYRFGSDVQVFGKLYPSKHEPHSFKVMQGLRAAGFGDGPHQVVEPLAFLPDHGFLLTRTARGIPLMNFIGKEGAEVLEGVRRAARWLVQLHDSPLRIGPPETLWRSMRLFAILRRLAKTAATMPHERNRLGEMIDRLCRKAGESRTRPPVVQVHGRFHHEHIYLSENTVTVIDLDQSFPSDPAKDLAEFVTMLRRRTFKRMGSLATAHEPTRAFLAEYNAHLPANMQNLTLYWGAAILLDLFHYKKKESGDEMAKRMAAFLEDDYDAVLSGELIRGSIG